MEESVVRAADPAVSFTDDSGAKPTALPPDLGTALLVVEFPPLDPVSSGDLLDAWLDQACCGVVSNVWRRRANCQPQSDTRILPRR
jgi:hypothetical protein